MVTLPAYGLEENLIANATSTPNLPINSSRNPCVVYIRKEDPTEALLQTILNFYGLPVLVVVGVIGNGCSIPILARLRTPSAVLLAILMSCDLLLLLCLFTVYSLPRWPVDLGNDRNFAIAVFNATKILQVFQAWMLTLIALDRCVAILRPFLYHRIATHNRAAVCCLVLFICSFTFVTPTFFAYRNQCCVTDEDQRICRIVRTSFGETKLFVNFSSWGIFAAIRALPTLLQILLVALTTTAIKKANKILSRQMGKFARDREFLWKERALTAILISVIIIHILLHVPVIANNIVRMQKVVKRNRSTLILNTVTPFLVALNCTVDFLAYVCGTKMCRQAVKSRLSKKHVTFRNSSRSQEGLGLTTSNPGVANSGETIGLGSVRKGSNYSYCDAV